MATVQAAGNTFDAPVFKIDFLLPNNVTVKDVDVIQATNLVGCDVLIGMERHKYRRFCGDKRR